MLVTLRGLLAVHLSPTQWVPELSSAESHPAGPRLQASQLSEDFLTATRQPCSIWVEGDSSGL